MCSCRGSDRAANNKTEQQAAAEQQTIANRTVVNTTEQQAPAEQQTVVIQSCDGHGGQQLESISNRENAS